MRGYPQITQITQMHGAWNNDTGNGVLLIVGAVLAPPLISAFGETAPAGERSVTSKKGGASAAPTTTGRESWASAVKPAA